jgi:uncharacterized protein YlxW (UPF0749 family)
LQAIGDPHTLAVALDRPGGLLSLLYQAQEGMSIAVNERAKLTVPVYDRLLQFAYARPVE